MASTRDNAARGASVDQGVSDVASTIGTSVRLVTLGSGPEYIPEALFAAVASLLESKAALRATVTWKGFLSNQLNKARRAGGPVCNPPLEQYLEWTLGSIFGDAVVVNLHIPHSFEKGDNAVVRATRRADPK